MQMKIGERFKNYEAAYGMQLSPRFPIIIRTDGRAFHTFAKKAHLERPFSQPFSEAMEKTALALCQETHAVIAYTQSDEISLLLLNDKKYETQPWFNNKLNKMVAITASIASVTFSLEMSKILNQEVREIFDSRAFIIPNHEIANYFIWRQLDAIRNAKNTWSEFTLGAKMGRGTARKQLHGLSANEQVECVRKLTGKNFYDSIEVPPKFAMGLEFLADETGYIVQAPEDYIQDKSSIESAINYYYNK